MLQAESKYVCHPAKEHPHLAALVYLGAEVAFGDLTSGR
jgi:hypothetical protein